jgi:hypothetical protein
LRYPLAQRFQIAALPPPLEILFILLARFPLLDRHNRGRVILILVGVYLYATLTIAGCWQLLANGFEYVANMFRLDFNFEYDFAGQSPSPLLYAVQTQLNLEALESKVSIRLMRDRIFIPVLGGETIVSSIY